MGIGIEKPPRGMVNLKLQLKANRVQPCGHQATPLRLGDEAHQTRILTNEVLYLLYYKS
jgi:hypothetical protein